MAQIDTFKTRTKLPVGGVPYDIFSLKTLQAQFANVAKLPFSLKVLLENLLRFEDGRVVKKEHVDALVKWDPKAEPDTEISFSPARVLLQDFTGVPVVVDLAVMREALASMGGNPQKVNPLCPLDLVIDHSVMIDKFGTTTAFRENVDIEFERNTERYAFLKWGQKALKNFRAVPPGTGICHQVNLEYLAQGVFKSPEGAAYPDSLVGTDSHTTMINGLGVVGWGVGGIEAEAAMLGQPITMLIPQVVGFKLTGKLAAGATATDLVLTVTQMLRKRGVVGKFVEFFGPGISALPLTDRATVANMAPEYGATIGFFPIDEATLDYLRLTGRSPESVALVEAYAKEQGLFHTASTPDPIFSDTLELDLSTVEPCLAGPARPQDRVLLKDMKASFAKHVKDILKVQDGDTKLSAKAVVTQGPQSYELTNGAVVIASITSCTNTSNPSVLLAAGLLAKKAVELGVTVKPWVKTSLAPGSQVVTDYLTEAGLMPYLEALGFHVVGYGCTTCIGNSGPLPQPVTDAIVSSGIAGAAVISGNRNFEGRVHPHVRMNFLASPPLVVAYAIAGHTNWDPNNEAIGTDKNGKAIFLKDLWPSTEELNAALKSVKSEQFKKRYADVLKGDVQWQALKVKEGATFEWDPKSTYVRKPPFFDNMPREPLPVKDITGARVLALLGDSITTDHISPAGDIDKKGPAAKYLGEQGVKPTEFNSFGARRGNHEVMMRGTFANIRLKNLLVPGIEGGVTRFMPSGEEMFIYDAAMKYQAAGTPLVILAGAEYGTGSSRDWAAKGTMLLGVRAVITKSFERIHRSNLIGMGVIPLQFQAGEDATTLGLKGNESYSIAGIAEGLAPGKKLSVTATGDDGTTKVFLATCRIDTPNELDYYKHGGILQYVLRQLAKS
ncbi:MAG: aconitate hydratase AcnA [Archangium sp.]|nr:aconitate hydratase AcnA [Archangium sp.]MDP3154861.1 aconitate hydratase AcnA [Archangium sp.]MDP3575980.1 aconitate hydratase AcnA [Archangium sp.]